MRRRYRGPKPTERGSVSADREIQVGRATMLALKSAELSLFGGKPTHATTFAGL
jgi:hypothetical protein